MGLELSLEQPWPCVGSLCMGPLLGSPLCSSFPGDTGTCSGHQIRVPPAASTKVEKGTPKFCRKILLEVRTITAPWVLGGRGRDLCFWGAGWWQCQGAGECSAGPSGQAGWIQGTHGGNARVRAEFTSPGWQGSPRPVLFPPSDPLGQPLSRSFSLLLSLGKHVPHS